jgi:hypothetical protein
MRSASPTASVRSWVTKSTGPVVSTPGGATGCVIGPPSPHRATGRFVHRQEVGHPDIGKKVLRLNPVGIARYIRSASRAPGPMPRSRARFVRAAGTGSEKHSQCVVCPPSNLRRYREKTALPNSSAIPLPGALDGHRIPLPAGAIDFCQAIDIDKSLVLKRRFFGCSNGLFPAVREP